MAGSLRDRPDRRRPARKRLPYRRNEILRVAVDLFHRDGVVNTNVEVIAKEAGIRPASLYHHFRDKQAIVDAAVDLAQAQLVARLEKPPSGGKPESRIAALVDELADCVLGNVPLAAVGRYGRIHASPRVRRRAEQVESLLLEAISSALAEARPKLPDGRRRALAHALIGAVWAVAHSDLRLEPSALRQYLGRAGRVIALGPPARRASAK